MFKEFCYLPPPFWSVIRYFWITYVSRLNLKQPYCFFVVTISNKIFASELWIKLVFACHCMLRCPILLPTRTTRPNEFQKPSFKPNCCSKGESDQSGECSSTYCQWVGSTNNCAQSSAGCAPQISFLTNRKIATLLDGVHSISPPFHSSIWCKIYHRY